MKQTFTPLLTLRFSHSYFTNELFRPLRVSYPENVILMFKNLGIISKPFPGGVNLFISDPEILKNSDKDQRISCYLNSSDPYFINYSELPNYKIKSNLLYFSNIETESSPIEAEGNILHKEEYVGVDEIFQLNNGIIDLGEIESGSEFEFKYVYGEELKAGEVNQISDDQKIYRFELPAESAVKIYQDNKLVRSIYVQTDQLWRKPFAIVDLFLGQLYDHYKAKKGTYTLKFECRQTYWIYYLVSPEFKKFKDLEIINKEIEPVFTRLEIKESDKETSWIFQSMDKINMSEQYDTNYQLVDKLNPEKKTYKPVIKNLESATVEQLFRKKETAKFALMEEANETQAKPSNVEAEDAGNSGETMYSHIYI